MAGLTKREIDLLFGGGAIGFAIGCAGMYFVCNKQLKLKYNKIADAEIQEMKAHYREKEMDLIEFQEKIARQPKPDIETIADHMKEVAKSELISEQEGYVEPEEEVDGEVVDSRWDYRDTWDYDREVRNRSREIPFVLHKDEFDAEEDATQVTVTYFEGDDVLVDEKDEVITKKDEVVGMDNLSQFGHGSGDPNVVYVRNAHLGVDYEILRHKGHYAKEVLGLEEESLEHSARPRRRMRFDDD
jgi:hypothetical protein